jgi:octaprenyl-diphosphate synthase
MAEGEVAQLEGAGNPDSTAKSYFEVIDRKTASLIAWCARVGGAVPAALDGPLGRYGRAIGRAFQIVDDILDCAAQETVAGKSVGHDLQEGKLTLPVLLACEAEPSLRERIRGAMGEQGMTAEAAAPLLTAVREAGGVERARTRALSLIEEAHVELNTLPPSRYREALHALATFCVERVS